MSAEGEQVVVTTVVLAKKNANRLNRIFRKAKSTVPARKWRSDEDVATRHFGISPQLIAKLVGELTAEEKQRAAANLDPLTEAQQELARRAARFGITLKSDIPAPKQPALPPVTFNVDEETLQRRAARFSTPEQAQAEEQIRQRLARFGGAAAAPAAPVQMSEEDKAAMEARAARFTS